MKKHPFLTSLGRNLTKKEGGHRWGIKSKEKRKGVSLCKKKFSKNSLERGDENPAREETGFPRWF